MRHGRSHGPSHAAVAARLPRQQRPCQPEEPGPRWPPEEPAQDRHDRAPARPGARRRDARAPSQGTDPCDESDANRSSLDHLHCTADSAAAHLGSGHPQGRLPRPTAAVIQAGRAP